MKTGAQTIAGITVPVTLSAAGNILSRRTRYRKTVPKPKRYVIYLKP